MVIIDYLQLLDAEDTNTNKTANGAQILYVVGLSDDRDVAADIPIIDVDDATISADGNLILSDDLLPQMSSVTSALVQVPVPISIPDDGADNR